MTREDEALLEDLRTARGEEAARRLYRTYAADLYGFAYSRLRDRGLAEEVVQEVFTRVWRNAGAYEASKGTVRNWLYGIARNAVIDSERHRSRRLPLARFEADEGAETDEPIERVLLRWQLQRAFDSLTPEHREVLQLGHFGGMSVKEIAEATGLAPGTVKSRTYYAMQNLRLALDEVELTP